MLSWERIAESGARGADNWNGCYLADNFGWDKPHHWWGYPGEPDVASETYG